MKTEQLQEILSELPNLANSGQFDRLRSLTRASLTDAKWWAYTGNTKPEEPPHLTFLSPSDTVPVTEKTLGYLTHVATSLFIPNVDRQVALFMLGRLSVGKITDRKTGNAFLLASAPELALSAPTRDLTRVVVFLYGNGTEIPIAVEDVPIPTNRASQIWQLSCFVRTVKKPDFFCTTIWATASMRHIPTRFRRWRNETIFQH
jgi:hypothetical protein